MKKDLFKQLMVLIMLIALSGCASTGHFNSAHLTNVELSENNFRIVATNVSGEASSGYLLGFSGAMRSETQTLALIRVHGKGLLYKEALEDFWKNFEEKYGSVESRDLALVNVRFDSDALNVLGLYTQPKISIRADVIEFVD